uniref:Uncharacterized protein n=1 Tax=Panagrellus redivivus TaxID=6233 RepID=A0A7E4W1N0_PANRE
MPKLLGSQTMAAGRYRRVAVIAALLGVLFTTVACDSLFPIPSKTRNATNSTTKFKNETLQLAKDDSSETDDADSSSEIDPSTENVDYKDFCSTANLYIATKGYKHRYAYGLTFDCTFFFFNIEEYPAVEILFDYFNFRYDLVGERIKQVCPVDLFEIKYIARFPKPYFEILDLKAGTATQIDVEKGNFYFYHYSPSSLHTDWQAPRNRWTSHYHSLLLHHMSSNNSKSGRPQVHYYIRHNNENHPGACFAESHGSTALLFQIRLVLGTEAIDLNNYMEDGEFHTPVVKRVAHYYFWGIIGEIILCGVTIIMCIILMTIKACQYYRYEACRYEVEKFVVSCYVEKLEKLSKLAKPKRHRKSKKKVEIIKKIESLKKSSPKKRKKKKKSPSSSSRSHHHHHHKKCHSESDERIPQGSKIIPLPLEKDLFASDKPKTKAPSAAKPSVKPADHKHPTPRRKESSNGSVCSLQSVTEPVENSFDWTSKGVKLSKRPLAIELYKKDLEKDEDEAYKLGMNISSLRRKRRLEQQGKPAVSKPNSERPGDGLTNSTMIKTMSHDLKNKKEEEAQLDKMQKAKAAAAAWKPKDTVTPKSIVNERPMRVGDDGSLHPVGGSYPPSTKEAGPWGSVSIPPSTADKKQD